MRVYLMTFCALLFFIPQVESAETTRVPSNYLITFELPSDRWEVSAEAPELAIKAMVVDMAHDKKKKGEAVDMAKLRQSAEQFIKVNNLFIYHRATEAYLMVSLSPPSRKGGAPTESAIQNSVAWTVKSLAEHAEVEDLEPYRTTVEQVDIPGMEFAQQITSNNPLFGDPHNFIGVIGYAHPYWVFLFYNDKAKDSEDFSEMRQIIKSIKLMSP